jgi:NADP-dependent 3-hydroxy acid dehydrogenase YdfG
MTNALVIGGTRGFGHSISDSLRTSGFTVQTIGRSEESTFRCDISDVAEVDETLRIIGDKMPEIDILACVVGYARAKRPSELTKEDWAITSQCNLGYINQALNILHDNIARSNLGKVITIGSRWSLRRDCELILPYIQAKHDLRQLVIDRAMEVDISCYCVPPMITPGFSEVSASFQELGLPGLPKGEFANQEEIARSIIAHSLFENRSGDIYIVAPNTAISLVH